MDNAGDFVIAWSSSGQAVKFFNSVHAQQYDSPSTERRSAKR